MNINGCKMAAASLAIILLAPATKAAERTSKAQPGDSIDVVSSVALTGKAIGAIQIAGDAGRRYLYLKDASKQSLTVVDVTDAAHPSIAKVMVMPDATANETVGLVVGNAALMITEAPKPATESPKAVSIVDLSSAAHPRVVRQFLGVTAMQVDEQRGLIYLVDDGGLQILKKHSAADQEMEREYARQVLYNR
jgi:hypothetical protein